MTDSIARIKSRAATQARLDLKGKTATRTGKTRKGKLNCTAGNKQCGNRCIPQAWDCRLEGKGTNSELKSHSHDPLGGVASIERGIKTIAKDPTSVQNLDRGRNSIIRGIVKTVPGDNLEKKKKLKRDLQKYGNQIGSALLLGATVIGAHQSAKRLNKSYARGLGRSIDMAAFGAVDAVLDRTPFVRDRRSNIRGNAVGVSEGLGRAFAFEARKQASEARALGNSGRIGPLSFPPGGTNFVNTGLVPSTQALQRRVRNGEVGYDQWVKESTGLLYGAKVKGQGNRSIYSDDAANRYISRQFGLNTPGALQRVGQIARSQSSRDGDVNKELSRRLSSWGDTMRADMELRRFERDKSGNFTSKAISSYVDTRVIPTMGFSRSGLSASQQNNARSQARNLAVDILGNVNKDKYDRQAATLRRNVVAQYDNYFSEVSDRMSLAGGSKQSTFGDGQVGLARYVMHQQPISGGRVVPVKSRSHANLILRDYFTRKVQNDRGGSFTASANTVQRVAQQINGSRELPDVGSAYSIVRESGISSLRSPSEAPSTTKKRATSKPKKPAKTGLAAQRSQSDLARAIMKRKGFEGSYAEALAQARREMKRSDTAEVREDAKKSSSTGKPCGESHIPKSHECSKTSSGRSAGYRARQVGSVALRVAAIPGGVALAAASIKARKSVLGMEGAIYFSMFGIAASAGAVQSLRNERRSTKTPEQFASDIRKLSKMPDADPAIVNQVAAFTEEAGIDQQRVGIMLDLNGIKGYFDSGKPNRLSANEKSRKGMSDADYQLLGKALQDHNSLRKGLTPYQQDARNVPKTYTYQKKFHGPISQLGESKDLQNSYGTYVKVHELGHAVHYRGGFKTASSVKVNGKTYAGQDLEKELMKSVGIYGQSDIRRSKATRDNYYSQGNRLETYAENFALYTLSGKAMKRDFPVAYEWTKQTTDNALRQPVKKDPAPFAELIATEGYKGFGTFDPTKGRKDAEDAKGDWYSQLQDAAAAGELAKAMKIFAANGKGLTEIEIGIALQWIEAASVTKVAKREMK